MPVDTKNAAAPMAMQTYKGGLKGYWKSRGYHRADGEGGRRPRPNQAELGGGARRRRSWNVKIKRRLRFLRRISPRHFLARVRDAYVSLMLRIASSPAVSYGGCGFGGEGFGAPRTVGGYGRQAMKEYDEKMIVEICKKLAAQGPLLAAAAAAAAGGEGRVDAVAGGGASVVAHRR